ncbi:MAG: DnaJ domain-containing protein [Deltaproteobacteria bacterium]|nr:DnaJ domain-containing protein [Deltaproteobacteria bacterium]
MMQEKWGKVSDIGFPRLLHNIFIARNTASILDMEDRKIKKRLFFKTGIPIYGISNILNEVLGRFMVRKGIITQEVYEKSLEIMLNEKKKQGEVLLLKGRVTPHQLNDALNIQAKERLFSAFGWTNGTYHYYTIEKLPKDLFLYPIHPAYAILYAVRMGYYPIDKVKTEMEKNRNQIVSFSPKTVYTLDDFQPTSRESRIFALINGRKKIDDILAEIETAPSLKKEDIYPFIYTLITTDVITVKQEKSSGKGKISEGPSPEDKALIENLTAIYIRLKSINYFEALGIGQNADNGNIRKAYFKMAKEYHPDRYHNNTHEVRTAASDIFTLINTAYTTLSDEKTRKTYKESLKSGGKQDIALNAANIMNAELQFQKGKTALSRKDYKNANEAFDYTLKLNPDEGEYKSYLGWTIFNLSPKNAAKVKIARELIQEGISSNPKQDRAYYFLGVIHRTEGKIDEAETAFNKAVQKNPNIQEALNELRLIQMRKQRGGKVFQTGIY